MRKTILFLILIFAFLPLSPGFAAGLTSRLGGKILLEVQERGQAWYVDPLSQTRAFLGRPADALRVMRGFGLGVSEADFNSFAGTAPARLKGRILLRVQAHGEAYWVNPDNLKLVYLGRPTDALSVMREYGLGITDTDLAQIAVSAQYQETTETNTTPPLAADNETGQSGTNAGNGGTETQTGNNNDGDIRFSAAAGSEINAPDGSRVEILRGKISTDVPGGVKISQAALLCSGTPDGLNGIFTQLYLSKSEAASDISLLGKTAAPSGLSVKFTGLDLAVDGNAAVNITANADIIVGLARGQISCGWDPNPENYRATDAVGNEIDTFRLQIESTAGNRINVLSRGSWTGNIDQIESAANANQNIDSGGISLVGRLRFGAKYEDIVVNDLVLQNTGTAENDTLAKLYLFADKAMNVLLGAADVASGLEPKALFSGVDILVRKTGVTYIYIGAEIRPIDYSSSPRPEATGQAGTTIIIRVPANSGAYATKVTGVDSGEDLGFSDIPSDTTRTSTVYGAIISNLTTAFADGPLFNGVGREIFSFKVAVPDSANLDPDGEPLGIKLGTIRFDVAKNGSLGLDNFRVSRTGGSDGEQNAEAGYNPSTGALVIDFAGTYGDDTDLTVRPGDTAEFTIAADISGVEANNTLQVSIQDVNDDVTYSQPISATADLENITPKLGGLLDLTGGTLTNR